MRIPRKNGEAVIVLGGRSGAFVFGFWGVIGGACGLSVVLSVVRFFGAAAAWAGF